MKKILIAHQSTIPHYRVPFYNALERLKPNTWRFDVVFDPKESSSPRFFNNPLDMKQFQFPILTTNTLTVRVCGIMMNYQTFWRKAAEYDLIIVGRALNNIAYPLCQLHQIMGRKVAYWGHDRDRKALSPARWKCWAEQLKIWSTQRADGFFAYTPAVKSYLENHGMPAAKIFVINNTIDIQAQRITYQKYEPQREKIRRDLGLTHKKVLLFVGRFSANKRLDFLIEAFNQLQKWDDSFHLLLVGEGQKSYDGLAHVTSFGPIIDLESLGPIYVASDVFVMTGAIGLAPLQALCFNLACVVLDWPANGPEFEYLSPSNGVILPANVTPDEYARAIVRLFDDEACLATMRMNTWASIQHLTVEAMAKNFIQGVNTILEC